MTMRLTASPAWQALAAPCRDHARRRTCASCSRTIPSGSSASRCALDDLLLDYSKNRITAETMGLLLDLARAADVEGWRDQDVRGREDQHHRGPRGPARGPAQPLQPAGPGRRRGRDAGRSTPCWSGCATSPSAVRGGAWRGHTGERDHRHRQHRHRRLRPRAGDGLRGARSPTARRTCGRTSSPTSTARTWPHTLRRASTRRAPCSSSPPRPSPPRRP